MCDDAFVLCNAAATTCAMKGQQDSGLLGIRQKQCVLEDSARGMCFYGSAMRFCVVMMRLEDEQSLSHVSGLWNVLQRDDTIILCHASLTERLQDAIVNVALLALTQRCFVMR